MPDPATYYLTTPENGFLFFADRHAAPGVTLTQVCPNPPFDSGRGLIAADTVHRATNSRSEPYRIWRVAGTPLPAPGRLADGWYRFDRLTVIDEVTDARPLGAHTEQVRAFLDDVRELRASDLHACQSVADEWWAAHPGLEDDSLIPAYQALDRANQAAQDARLPLMDVGHTVDLAASAAGQLFAVTGDRSTRNAYTQLKRNLTDAVYQAVRAILVRDQISPEDFRLLTEDWRRVTGRPDALR